MEELLWDPLSEPGSAPPGTGPRTVWVQQERDLFDAHVEERLIRDVFAAVSADSEARFLLLTTRAKRLLLLGNDGLPFPPNLWVGVRVESDADIWRVEDLLRCNTARAWASVRLDDTAAPYFPVSMLSWVVAVAPSGGGPWRAAARTLRDECITAKVSFRLTSSCTPPAPVELDGRIHWDLPPD